MISHGLLAITYMAYRASFERRKSVVALCLFCASHGWFHSPAQPTMLTEKHACTTATLLFQCRACLLIRNPLLCARFVGHTVKAWQYLDTYGFINFGVSAQLTAPPGRSAKSVIVIGAGLAGGSHANHKQPPKPNTRGVICRDLSIFYTPMKSDVASHKSVMTDGMCACVGVLMRIRI